MERKMIWRYAIMVCLITYALIGFVSAGSPAAGVAWDNYIADGVHHPAKAEINLQNKIVTLSATRPVSGTRPLLVLLVNSSDTPPQAAHSVTYFENLFFGSTAPNVADYYTEVSYGAFTFTEADVLGWYHSSYTTAEIANNNDGTKRWAMIRWAIQQAEADINFASYDTDNDGTVTNEELTIYVITSGLGGDWGGPAVWAHHWWAGTVTCDGKTIEGEYSITSEMNPAGTFAHELGHDLGLPDLYDADGGSSGIGHYGLMGSGSWCGPTHMTAWEKAQLGWLTPTVVPANGFYNIQDSETHSEAYILQSATHSSDEYFLVEYRFRGTSYDSRSGPEGNLNDEGLIIYHIDETKAAAWFGCTSYCGGSVNTVNNDEAHKGVDVECADHETSHVADADDLDFEVINWATDLYRRGDSNDLWDCNEYDFTDTSTPAKAIWYSGGASGLSVSLIPCVGTTMRTYLAITPNLPPTADANGPYSGVEGMAINFDGTGSSDPNGDPLEYSWDFGDGTPLVTGTATPTHTYCDNDIFTVTMTVTDPFGLSATGTTTATVTNVAPVADAGPDQTVDEGDTVQFTGSAIDAGICDTLSYAWDFGDGSAPVTGTLTPPHEYCDNGVYTATLTVTDDDGGVGTDMILITVNNVAPTITIGAMDQPNPEFILPMHTLTLHATFSDPGWCDTHTAMWDFGDGQTSVGTLTEENIAPDATGTVIATHAISAPGDYSVTVTVTDDDGGATTSAAWIIHIADVAEAKHILAAYIQNLPSTAFKGKAVQQKATFANKFVALDHMIANEEWNGFITSLQADIRSKADGMVDGKTSDDWIKSVTAQQHICMKIDDIVAYVKTLI